MRLDQNRYKQNCLKLFSYCYNIHIPLSLGCKLYICAIKINVSKHKEEVLSQQKIMLLAAQFYSDRNEAAT